MTKTEIEKMQKTEAELARLKLRLEIIRTICPILAIALQIIILVRVFQARIFCKKTCKKACFFGPICFIIYLRARFDFFGKSARSRQSAKSTFYLHFCRKLVTKFVKKVIVFFSARGRQCESDKSMLGVGRADYSTCKTDCQVFFVTDSN